MDSLSDLLLTSVNHFSWKSHMFNLQCREIYQVTFRTKSVLTPLKKAKYDTKKNEAHVLIGMYISNDLQFHL
jgi:hypothetical protein